ncbi:hypothetical protein [Novosphingobium sp. 9]|uniref:hypothetical protein n=1 Tax=Novosphingobium sp. 9 TaxID=2025349 RepID=UPI0021B6E715|nr:hypothetical protein [Novosphingobium sp. 9]
MYQFVDRPLSSLDAGCRFLVWSMRAWVTTIGRRQCPAQALAPVFARWRMIGALQPFHRMMLLFNRDALETFGFCQMACDHVSEHEALVVALIEQLGQGRNTQVRETLGYLVSEDSVGEMLEALSGLGAAMALAGILPEHNDAR